MQSAKLCSSRRNWDSPNPSSPPFSSGGRGTLACERGGGRVPIPTMGHSLWYSIYNVYVLLCDFLVRDCFYPFLVQYVHQHNVSRNNSSWGKSRDQSYFKCTAVFLGDLPPVSTTQVVILSVAFLPAVADFPAVFNAVHCKVPFRNYETCNNAL
jgi:hypothetical protein